MSDVTYVIKQSSSLALGFVIVASQKLQARPSDELGRHIGLPWYVPPQNLQIWRSKSHRNSTNPIPNLQSPLTFVITEHKPIDQTNESNKAPTCSVVNSARSIDTKLLANQKKGNFSVPINTVNLKQRKKSNLSK